MTRGSRLLYDSSAFLNTIRLYGSRAVRLIRGNYTLSLTAYEIGNALWKESKLLKKISLDEAVKSLLYAIKLLSKTNIVEPSNKKMVLELAWNVGLTYYDASYIVASHEIECVLVSDDQRLSKKLSIEKQKILEYLGRGVEVISSRELVDLV